VNPDGDGLGSELALARFLQKRGKTTTILNHSETPDNYTWLDDRKEILKFDAAKHAPVLRSTEVILIVDTNQPDRLRSMEKDILASKAVKIIIDHHLEPHSFATHTITDVDATSTGEIVYRLIDAIDDTSFDKDIARYLYAAIMTDTGSFHYPRTVGDTHRIAARLLDLGANPTEVFANIFEQWSPGRIRLLGCGLESMTTAYDGKLAYISFTRDSFRETGTTEADTDNFTVYPMSIKGAVIGILFIELPDGVKISFRSKGSIPINELAKEFGGNGHLNAAGARLHNVSLDEIVERVIEKAKKYLP
jgi:phosphoesterase RecJ-like protein